MEISGALSLALALGSLTRASALFSCFGVDSLSLKTWMLVAPRSSACDLNSDGQIAKKVLIAYAVVKYAFFFFGFLFIISFVFCFPYPQLTIF